LIKYKDLEKDLVGFYNQTLLDNQNKIMADEKEVETTDEAPEVEATPEVEEEKEVIEIRYFPEEGCRYCLTATMTGDHLMNDDTGAGSISVAHRKRHYAAQMRQKRRSIQRFQENIYSDIGGANEIHYYYRKIRQGNEP